jgi:Protein of unknown function (DUF3311)
VSDDYEPLARGPVPRAEPGAKTAGYDERWRISPTKWLVGAILSVGIIVPLLVSTYDSIEPRLFGFPFFYWYQLLWVFIAAGLCGLSFWLLKRERDAYLRDHPTAGRGEGR